MRPCDSSSPSSACLARHSRLTASWNSLPKGGSLEFSLHLLALPLSPRHFPVPRFCQAVQPTLHSHFPPPRHTFRGEQVHRLPPERVHFSRHGLRPCILHDHAEYRRSFATGAREGWGGGDRDRDVMSSSSILRTVGRLQPHAPRRQHPPSLASHRSSTR